MLKVFENFEGNDIAGSIYGEESNPLVIFLHGGVEPSTNDIIMSIGLRAPILSIIPGTCSLWSG